MSNGRCVCGLNKVCPYGSTDLSCPVWQEHVRPSIWERIVGIFVSLFGEHR